MSALLGQVMKHATINQAINESFSSWYCMMAYNLCLRAGCEVIDASLEISGPLTTPLSAPKSHNLKSQVGILSLGFCQNRCTKSINLVAVLGWAVTCR